MHLTFHFTLGIICASILSYFTVLSPFLFGIVVFAACIPDMDILFRKFAHNNNHRQLISHSIIIPTLIISIGLIFQTIIITFCGIAYLTHVFVDLIDWGTNIVYNGKSIFNINILKKNTSFGF